MSHTLPLLELSISRQPPQLSLLRAPHFGMVSQTLPLQLTQPRHPHGTQEILLSAATFLS